MVLVPDVRFWHKADIRVLSILLYLMDLAGIGLVSKYMFHIVLYQPQIPPNTGIKHFSVKLLLDDGLVAKGRATSKKKAEEIASKRAFYKFQDLISL